MTTLTLGLPRFGGTVDVPEYDAPVASPKRLTVGPVTSVGSSASVLEVPDKPNLHTFKRIHCAVPHDSSFKTTREKAAEAKLINQNALTNFVARAAYIKNPNVDAHAIFNGKEISERREDVIEPGEDGNGVVRESSTTTWQIQPLLLEEATAGPNSWSPYACAMIPTMSEFHSLTRLDPKAMTAKKIKPLKNRTNDRRRRGKGNR